MMATYLPTSDFRLRSRDVGVELPRPSLRQPYAIDVALRRPACLRRPDLSSTGTASTRFSSTLIPHHTELQLPTRFDLRFLFWAFDFRCAKRNVGLDLIRLTLSDLVYSSTNFLPMGALWSRLRPDEACLMASQEIMISHPVKDLFSSKVQKIRGANIGSNSGTTSPCEASKNQ